MLWKVISGHNTCTWPDGISSASGVWYVFSGAVFIFFNLGLGDAGGDELKCKIKISNSSCFFTRLNARSQLTLCIMNDKVFF